jgi:hypothetical protein
MTKYDCPGCAAEFELPAYEEGECPKCGLRFELEDDFEGRCLPIWETDPRSSYKESTK